MAFIGIITKASVSSLESSCFSKYSGAPQGHYVIFHAKGPPLPLPPYISLLYIICHISLLHPRWDEQCRDTMMTVPPQLTSSLLLSPTPLAFVIHPRPQVLSEESGVVILRPRSQFRAGWRGHLGPILTMCQGLNILPASGSKTQNIMQRRPWSRWIESAPKHLRTLMADSWKLFENGSKIMDLNILADHPSRNCRYQTSTMPHNCIGTKNLLEIWEFAFLKACPCHPQHLQRQRLTLRSYMTRRWRLVKQISSRLVKQILKRNNFHQFSVCSEVHVASDAQSDCAACHNLAVKLCLDDPSCDFQGWSNFASSDPVLLTLVALAKAIFFTSDVFSDFFSFFRQGPYLRLALEKFDCADSSWVSAGNSQRQKDSTRTLFQVFLRPMSMRRADTHYQALFASS